MKKLIIKSNTWYDNQKEPKRFLIFLSILMPSILLINSNIPELRISGGLILLTATLWRILGNLFCK